MPQPENSHTKGLRCFSVLEHLRPSIIPGLRHNHSELPSRTTRSTGRTVIQRGNGCEDKMSTNVPHAVQPFYSKLLSNGSLIAHHTHAELAGLLGVHRHSEAWSKVNRGTCLMVAEEADQGLPLSAQCSKLPLLEASAPEASMAWLRSGRLPGTRGSRFQSSRSSMLRMACSPPSQWSVFGHSPRKTDGASRVALASAGGLRGHKVLQDQAHGSASAAQEG